MPRRPDTTTSGTRRPTAPALGLVRVASRLLPDGGVRTRYRWEFVADLHHLDRSHQLAYATGVLSTAWQLRRELSQETATMASDHTPNGGRAVPLLCRLHLHHRWRTEHNDAGEPFRRCRACGKDDPGSFADRPSDTFGGGVSGGVGF